MASYRNYGAGRCGSGRPRVPSGVSPYDQKRAIQGEKRCRKRILDAALVETFHHGKHSWLRNSSSCLSRLAAVLSVTVEDRPLSSRVFTSLWLVYRTNIS